MAQLLRRFKRVPTCRILSVHMSSSVQFIRHVNPIRENKDSLVESLCQKLSQEMPQKYAFLRKEAGDSQELRNLLNQMVAKGDDDKSLVSTSLFESWMGQSNSLSLVYFLHANRDNFHSAQFLAKIVQHLSTNLSELGAEEVVALWLSLYFTRRIWTTEELFEFLDMNEFQSRLEQMIRSRRLSNTELCCVFIAMKKVSGLSLYSPVLRTTLHQYLAAMAPHLNQESELLISQMLPIMQQDSLVKRDQDQPLFNLLNAYHHVHNAASFQALLHVMYHCIRAGDHVHHPELTYKLVDRIIHTDDIQSLSVNELKKLVRLLSRLSFLDFDKSVSDRLLKELSKIADHECKMTDTRDILQSWVYLLVSFDSVDSENLKKAVHAINELPSEVVGKPGKEFAREVIKAVHRTFFPNSASNEEKLNEEFTQMFSVGWQIIPKFVASLDQTIAIMRPDLVPRIGSLQEPLLEKMVNVFKSPAPNVSVVRDKKQYFALPPRHKTLLQMYSEVIENLPGESYANLIHIIPHFLEADLVFGHIAGIPLSLPEELLTDDHKLKRAPVVGEWCVVSPTKMTDSKISLLKALGFSPYDLGESSAKSGSYYGKMKPLLESIFTGRSK